MKFTFFAPSFLKFFWSIFDIAKIKEKFESIAHKEFNNDKFKNFKHIDNCQRTGADLFHRKVKTKKINKNFFPSNLLKLMEENSIFYFGSNK